MSIYERGLQRRDANHVALSPIDFLVRASEVYGGLPAVVYGRVNRTWGETFERCVRLASALASLGIKRGDTVAVMLPNIPAMVETHFGVPMAGAVLNALNTRLEAASILYMIEHGEAKVLIVDTEFAAIADRVRERFPEIKIICVRDFESDIDHGAMPNDTEYEDFIASGDSNFEYLGPEGEWDAIALNYTSGTKGNPKRVVYHHRGTYLCAISNALEWDLEKHPSYLWTLPMFHCYGWTFPWAVAARAGINVCLRRVDAKVIFDLIRRYRVTHYCGAPIVHSTIANAPEEWRAGIEHKVKAMVAGAAPGPTVIARMAEIGFDLLHVYGLTEVYGPAAVCAKQQARTHVNNAERVVLNARQGVRYHLQAGTTVRDPHTMEEVPKDGQTIGEVMFRGNITMKGYLKNEKATEEALAGGWYRTGDLGVLFPDGYVKPKDRSKDIIISGGENISSIEVEDGIYSHPAVAVVAVVAQPDAKWGEVPCAFVERRPGQQASESDIIAHCKSLLAGFKVPKAVRFCELPKTFPRKIQKFALRQQIGSAAAISQSQSYSFIKVGG
ncbi:acyl-CoA synthetase [Paraburkholderia atlantica]|uniref:acyl-CoA synthetase n=1 Tax=Paraburkholderia atlantica TaxID=2654982 RepID=UPI00161B1F55|nr:acyl-CoA synthetase [Paraburkholderia atlantica]MBB5510280.1 fatty-acyl-CoA synthase [Paraburkholderia atlantica]